MFGTMHRMLMVGYYDYLNSQSREDYFTVEKTNERIYTSVKKYSEGRNYMVFRRAFKNSVFASPNSCFVTPLIGHLPAPDILRHSRHVGSKILEIATTDDTRTERHIRTNVWDVDWYVVVLSRMLERLCWSFSFIISLPRATRKSLEKMENTHSNVTKT